MNLQKECVDCIYNQSKRVSSFLHVNKNQAQAIDEITKKHIQNFNFNLTPPHNAFALYEEIAKYLNTDDIYAKMKKEASEKASEFIFTCKKAIENSEDKFKAAIQCAIVGNVLDLAAEVMFDLDTEVAKVFEMPFAIDDLEALRSKLENTKTLVYLADNAGEEIFDKICIETIQKLYPKIKVFYFVRGKPIINDLTIEEAKASGLDSITTLVNSGVPTPGYTLDLANETSKELFLKADCIISKGMGNYECLGTQSGFGFPVFFLFKVKCAVVAREIGAKIADIVCKKLN
jgi:damage-control phosphatase, subfamily I